MNLPVISAVFKNVPYVVTCSPENRLSDILNLLEHSEDGISQEDRHALMNFLIKDSYCAGLSLLSLRESRDALAELPSPTSLTRPQDYCKPETKSICKQGVLSAKRRCDVLEVPNKSAQEPFDVRL